MIALTFRMRDLPDRPRDDDDGEYINECCRGGDLVVTAVLPLLRARCDRVLHGQEDWGWFAWSHGADPRLAIEASCDDVDSCEMAVRVAAHRRGPWWRLFAEAEVDGAELEPLVAEVVAALEPLAAGPIEVERPRASR